VVASLEVPFLLSLLAQERVSERATTLTHLRLPFKHQAATVEASPARIFLNPVTNKRSLVAVFSSLAVIRHNLVPSFLLSLLAQETASARATLLLPPLQLELVLVTAMAILLTPLRLPSRHQAVTVELSLAVTKSSLVAAFSTVFSDLAEEVRPETRPEVPFLPSLPLPAKDSVVTRTRARASKDEFDAPCKNIHAVLGNDLTGFLC
jgi:hypothetical protein